MSPQAEGNPQSKLRRALARLLFNQSPAWSIAAWIVVLLTLFYYTRSIIGIGLDLRQDYWVYWRPNRFIGDIDNAMHMGDRVLREATKVAAADRARLTPDQIQSESARTTAGHPPLTIAAPGVDLLTTTLTPSILRQRIKDQSPLYWQIIRGWVAFYEDLEHNPADPNQGLDYPPLRLMTMTLWTWHVQSHFPGMHDVPENPRVDQDAINHRRAVADVDVAQPLLHFNTACDAASAIAMFFLVWIWADRRPHPHRLFRRARASTSTSLFSLPSPSPLLVSAGWGEGLLRMFRRKHPRGSAAGAASRTPTWRHALLWPTPAKANLIAHTSWQSRWGDPLLLAPVILLGVVLLLWNNVTWIMIPSESVPSIVDARVTRIGWWILLGLQYLSIVCLARLLPRPYRAPICAMIAATIIWINPASLLDSAAWPQWEVWLPPFFLWAAVMMSLNCWALAGALLGVGCMFKGQLLFVSPVIILCPLLAGWPWRFICLLAGFAAAAGIVVSPFLFDATQPLKFIAFAVAIAALFCVLSLWRRPFWHHLKLLADDTFSRAIYWWKDMRARHAAITWIATLLLVAILLALVAGFPAKLLAEHWRPSLVVILGLSIVTFPWFAPRRLLPGWILTVFAASIWIAASQYNAKTSWWDVGFIYGTQKHPVMQLGEHSLSNLSSIMHERFGWELHDHVFTLNWSILPPDWRDFDVQRFQGLIYGIAAILCSIGAAIHLRRRDPRFLVSLAAPWILFVALLTQMASRYTALPALVAAAMIGVSVGMSLFPAIMTIIGFAMLGNQMFARHPDTAPITFSITRAWYPDAGWLMLILAAVFLYAAIIPGRRTRPFTRDEGLIA
jgi:hypothetical protein